MPLFWAGKKGKRTGSEFWDDQSGQATVEYVVMLAVTIAFAVGVMRQLISPTYQKLAQFVGDALDNRINKADLHTFRITR